MLDDNEAKVNKDSIEFDDGKGTQPEEEVTVAYTEPTPESVDTIDEEGGESTEELTDELPDVDVSEPYIEYPEEKDDYDYSNQSSSTEDGTVTVQPVKFASFEDLEQAHGETNKNLDILMDIKLQLTVELGRTELPIKKVLELTRGSIIELEKVAGEPVELYANGKLIAHGEVVVIEDNFGLRITSITDPDDRIKGLQ